MSPFIKNSHLMPAKAYTKLSNDSGCRYSQSFSYYFEHHGTAAARARSQPSPPSRVTQHSHHFSTFGSGVEAALLHLPRAFGDVDRLRA